jgi:hypothetical protein
MTENNGHKEILQAFKRVPTGEPVPDFCAILMGYYEPEHPGNRVRWLGYFYSWKEGKIYTLWDRVDGFGPGTVCSFWEIEHWDGKIECAGGAACSTADPPFLHDMSVECECIVDGPGGTWWPSGWARPECVAAYKKRMVQDYD